jgi:uncharacterized protein (TIGR02145 family)
MKRIMSFFVLVCFVIGITVIQSCKKDPVPPSLTTTAVTNITINSATSGGNITNDGGAGITARGICWGLNTNPSLTDSYTSDDKGAGSFVSNLTDLTPNTVYHIRAYATNKAGTAYGTDVTFTTTAILVPTLTTTDASLITLTSAVSGGNITSDGNAAITARGVCWSTSLNPTVDNSKTSDQTGTGSFISTLTGLTSGTLYHIRAYATNSVGTAYGNDVTFTTTAASVPSLTTNAITSPTLTSAVSGGNVTSENGSAVTARGICWSTSVNPTIANSKVANGAGLGTYSCNLTGLTPATTYYVRAYATNGIGTGYGNEISFTTGQIVPPTLTTTIATDITYTTATSGGNVAADGGAPVTAKGICYSLTPNPTILSQLTSVGTGLGIFTSNLTGLTAGTKYYYRAYAINSAGPGYGNELSFTTTAYTVATLTTSTVTSISYTTAVSGGNITANGGAAVTSRGICWALTADPTTDNFKAVAGTAGSGTFTVNLTGLTPGTNYHVRAYAINSAGTAYGNDQPFTTNPLVAPAVSTASVTAVTLTSATSGGNVTSAGGGTVTRGVCWSTSTTPTVALTTKTTDGSGTGTFTSSITGLTPGTTYYVRAYADNGAFVTYGSEFTFNTRIADGDGITYSVIKIGSQMWMGENLKTTSYSNNGTPVAIGTTATPTTDISAEPTPKYQWVYEGNESYAAVYGRLYTWYAATDARNICPTGWSVPTDDQWEALKTTLLGELVAGGKLKETGTAHWLAPNTGATNEVGFTAVPGGYRLPTVTTPGDPFFVSMGERSYFWSSTPGIGTLSWGQGASNVDAIFLRNGYTKTDGVSVRCIKN